MTDFPDLKIKALVSFPAAVFGGTGLAVRQENGKFYFDLAYGELAQISSIPDVAEPTSFLALWESTQDTYRRINVTDFKTEFGGVSPATAVPLVESGAGAVGVSLKYAREDHVHPAGGGGGGGSTVYVQDTPPVGAAAGSLWWESDTGILYIYYNDGTSSQWVTVSGGAIDPGAIRYDTVQSLTAPQKTQARSNIGAAGLDVANAFTDATPATSPTTGALKAVGGISSQDAIYAAKKIASTASSLSGGQFDASGSASISINNGANAPALPGTASSAWLVVLAEVSIAGYTGLFICTTGNQPMTIFSNNAGLVSGVNVAAKISFGWDGTQFSIYNNVGAGPAVFHVMALKY